MNERTNSRFGENTSPQQRNPIRVWRDETPFDAERMAAFPERYARSSLRKERALSGRDGYDLNRHIRLMRQRNRSGQKQKTPSLKEGVSVSCKNY